MRIQHNIAALNAHRQLGGNNNAVSKNLEKLSSGFKINRAGDDAAGLAISEKMRAQIKGLETASKNASDGISLIQTAEGALTEVHSMLNRMVELATQSANGTYGTTERTKLQDEITALNDEIDRISQATNYNGIDLLDGSLGGARTGVPGFNSTGTGITQTTTAATKSSVETGSVGTIAAGNKTAEITYKDAAGNAQKATINYTATGTAATDAAAIAAAINADATFSKLFSATVTNTDKITFKSNDTGSKAPTIVGFSPTTTAVALTGGTAGADATLTADLSGLVNGETITIDGKVYEKVAAGGTAATQGAAGFTTIADLTAAAAKNGITVGGTLAAATIAYDPTAVGTGLELQVGDTNAAFQRVTVSVDAMDATSLGIRGIDISNQPSAQAATDIIKAAIEKVSTARGGLGALQNRLDHTINNLGVTTENMTAAESRIRDVDMAKEMMDFTKNNILTQSAQAMLAQANQIPQGVLQLLQ